MNYRNYFVNKNVLNWKMSITQDELCELRFLKEMINVRDRDQICNVYSKGRNLNNLRYADDTVLMAENEQQLQLIVDKVNQVGRLYGMEMNVKKTKTMVISKNSDKQTIKIKIDGKVLEQVDKYVYLGQLINNDANCDTEIRRRLEIARGAFSKLNVTLTTNKISLETRKRLWKCYVWSTLLYGAETWTVRNEMVKKIEAFEMWAYRKMLRIAWIDKVTNVEVLMRVCMRKTLLNTIKQRKMSYFGHMVRREDMQRLLLEGYINGRRGRGRPRVSWMRNITEWTGKKYEDTVRATYARTGWRFIASNPRTEEGT